MHTFNYLKYDLKMGLNALHNLKSISKTQNDSLNQDLWFLKIKKKRIMKTKKKQANGFSLLWRINCLGLLFSFNEIGNVLLLKEKRHHKS